MDGLSVDAAWDESEIMGSAVVDDDFGVGALVEVVVGVVVGTVVVRTVAVGTGVIATYPEPEPEPES